MLRIRTHGVPRRRALLGAINAEDDRDREARLATPMVIRVRLEHVVHGLRRSGAVLQHLRKVCGMNFSLLARVALLINRISTRNVLQAKRARNEEPYIALAGYLPFLYQWTLVPIYLYLQPTILYQHLIPFIIYVGLINAYAVGRIIVAHLLQGPFPYHNILLLPLFCGVVDSAGPWLQNHIGIGWPSALGDGMYQVAFLFLSLGLAVGVYGSFVVDVIFAICDYLDIWCLTIKHVRVDSKTGKEIGKEKKKKK